MDVTFYKTKLTRQNRCYGATEYDNYLNGCAKKVITLSHDIVPNNPFYLETDEGMWSYNYITYTYKGYLFGAFIDGIRIQALSSSTQIIHSTDSWYFALKNVGVGNMDFHGQCSRAHVNDIKIESSIHVPDLSFTTSSPEEVFNEINVIYSKNDNFFKWDNGNDLYYVYIYIANPRSIEAFSGIDIDQSIIYPYGERKTCANMGLTLTYPCYYKNGNFSFYSYDKIMEESVEHYIKTLTYTEITSIIVTKIPPRGDISIPSKSNLWNNTTFNKLETVQGQLGGYDFVFNYYTELTPYAFNANSILPNLTPLYSDTELPHASTYDEYRLLGIPKLLSSVYNPVFLFGNYVNSLKIKKADNFYISLTFDLSSTIVYSPEANLQGYSALNIRNNMLTFAPNAVNDYWTRLNALQTGLAGKITENNGALQGIKQNSKIIRNSISLLSNMQEGDRLNILQSGLTLGTDVASYNLERQNYENQQNIGKIVQETAELQYRSGKTTGKASSFFGFPLADESAALSGVDNGLNFDKLSINLHRYGYNTFLQLDDIYFNHKRTNFNYFLCSECEVTGVPTDIAEDIQNMFQSGVHLWSGEVENFEVPNYQEGLTW